MRIALFAETFLPKTDGVTNTLCQLLLHLARRGHEALMFAPEGTPDIYAKTPIVGLGSVPMPFYPELRLVPPAVDVSHRLRAFAPDLVHLANPALLGWVGLRHAREMDVPVVASYHTDIPGYAEHYGMPVLNEPLWAYFRWIHNQANLNLCPSRYTLEQLRARGFQRLGIWGRGVDTERFQPRKRSRNMRLRLSSGHVDDPLLLYVGRLAAEKRVDWLLHALRQAPGARLAIVGDGPMRAELEAKFTGRRTVFMGYLHGEELAQAYASADLFCFPAANETLGNVVLEAMASGLPVVAAASGGPMDHVRNGVNGWLFPADIPPALGSRVQQMLATPELLRTMSQRARAYALQQSWEAVLDGLLAHYRSVLRPRGPEAGERLYGEGAAADAIYTLTGLLSVGHSHNLPSA
jgi:glycosyltransferase involved in cell wall biosynthesis